MKFIVRDGFVVTLITIATVNGQPSPREQSFYGGDTVDLDSEQADAHLHKLEPVDKAATTYASSKAVPAPAAPGGFSPEVVQAMIAQAVAQALAAQATAATAATAAATPPVAG